MSDFAGLICWSGGEGFPRQEHDFLGTFRRLPGYGPAVITRTASACIAFCQSAAAAEDGLECQPAAAGAVISMFDGRVDGREALARRLDMPSVTTPDAALALAAFRRWGADAPREMLGEFSWAVWDGDVGRLVLARDVSASRTLYVWRNGDRVAFATGLPALLRLPGVPREIDEQGLAEFITLIPGQEGRTIYRHVRHVMAGTTLVIGPDTLRQAGNWQPEPRFVPRDPLECAEAARDLFDTAMRDRLRTIGQAAVSLSGGLDSSIIAGVAAKQRTPATVLGLALVPPAGVPLVVDPGWMPDGRPQLQAMERRHGNLRVQYIEPPADPVDPIPLFIATGQPTALAPNLAWNLAAWRAAAAAGARTLFTGEDGEMSVTHYGSLPALVRQGSIRHALREAWNLSRRGRGGLRHHLDAAFLGGRLAQLRWKGAKPGDWEYFSPINPELAASARVRESLVAERVPGGYRHRPPGYAEAFHTYLRRRAGTVDNIATLRALTGLDHTCPFADRRLLEFCFSLPESMFVRDGQSRWLARTAFRDVLPPDVRDNPSKAEQNPEWFHNLCLRRSQLQEQLDHIEGSALARRALDIPRLRALLDRWPASAQEARAAGPAYRSILVRGLHVGAFLRWIDMSNSPAMTDDGTYNL